MSPIFLDRFLLDFSEMKLQSDGGYFLIWLSCYEVIPVHFNDFCLLYRNHTREASPSSLTLRRRAGTSTMHSSSGRKTPFKVPLADALRKFHLIILYHEIIFKKILYHEIRFPKACSCSNLARQAQTWGNYRICFHLKILVFWLSLDFLIFVQLIYECYRIKNLQYACIYGTLAISLPSNLLFFFICFITYCAERGYTIFTFYFPIRITLTEWNSFIF